MFCPYIPSTICFYSYWLIEVTCKWYAFEIDLEISKLFCLIVTDAEFKNSAGQPKYDGTSYTP